MVKADQCEIPEPDMPDLASPAPTVDSVGEIASLRLNGADHFDPVRFQFIESLAKRSLQHEGEVRLLLDAKLATELADYRARFDEMQGDTRRTLVRIAKQAPEIGEDLQRLFVSGDFSSLRRRLARREKKEATVSIADLVRHLAEQSPSPLDGELAGDSGGRSELKTIRYFRNTWSKLSVDKQVAQAIKQAPENAGPINSHRLVLRSLALMRDISPDYLNRFMSYADTLLWLEQADKKNEPVVKKPVSAKPGKKKKAVVE